MAVDRRRPDCRRGSGAALTCDALAPGRRSLGPRAPRRCRDPLDAALVAHTFGRDRPRERRYARRASVAWRPRDRGRLGRARRPRRGGPHHGRGRGNGLPRRCAQRRRRAHLSARPRGRGSARVQAGHRRAAARPRRNTIPRRRDAARCAGWHRRAAHHSLPTMTVSGTSLLRP